MHPPGSGLQRDPVLRRHLARLARRIPVVCCHLSRFPQPPPPGVELHQMPFRRWYFPPVRSWLPGSWSVNRYLRERAVGHQLTIGPSDAVLCCAHNREPLIAAKFARHFNAPLFILLQDMWSAHLTPGYRSAFRQAARILAVSDDLIAFLASRFGVQAELLPPIGEDPLPPPALPSGQGESPQVGVAGTLSDAYVRQALTIGSRILALGSPSGTVPHPGVTWVPRLAENLDALRLLQKNCRALFVWQPDDGSDYSRYSFPSRLVDFAQTGLPLIIKAAPGTSLGRWAADRRWSAHVRGDNDSEGLVRVRHMLADNPSWLAASQETQTLATGEFSAQLIQARLEGALGFPSTVEA